MFNSKEIITQHISHADLKTYFVGFDLGSFRYDALSEILLDAIVDFAFGYHTGILKKYDRRTLKEAATAIYNVKTFSDVKWVYVDNDSELDDDELSAEKKYLKKGEFGELILHLLLRDMVETIPLMSKIHFKDTDNTAIHGFDLVHIGPDLSTPDKESLYLGESKLFGSKKGHSGKKGINDLIEDIKDHFTKDFLYREIALIVKKKQAYVPLDEYTDTSTLEDYKIFMEKKKYWYDFLNSVEQKRAKLQDLLSSVTIPLLCTYQSNLFDSFSNEKAPEFLSAYEKEMSDLKNVFDDKLSQIVEQSGEPIRTNLNIILMLFPIPSKKNLVKIIHEKLYHQQHA